jgi:hypothetical protein
MLRRYFSSLILLSITGTQGHLLQAAQLTKNSNDFDLYMSDLLVTSKDRCNELLKEFREGFKKKSGLNDVLASCVQQKDHEGYAIVYFTEQEALGKGFYVESFQNQPFKASEEEFATEEAYTKIIVEGGKVSRETRVRTVTRKSYSTEPLFLKSLRECNEALAKVPEGAWADNVSTCPPSPRVAPFAKACILGAEGDYVFHSSVLLPSSEVYGSCGNL